MKKFLFINSCIRGADKSRTYSLCNIFINKIKQSCNDISFSAVDVSDKRLKPLTGEDIDKRDGLIMEGKLDDELFYFAKQFADAGYILIGAPYWDLSFPSQLKVYIENIMVSSVTFTCTENGYRGLCRAEKLIYICTAGGYFKDGVNSGYEYIRSIAQMLGINECTSVSAQGLDIQGTDVEKQLAKAAEQIKKLEL